MRNVCPGGSEYWSNGYGGYVGLQTTWLKENNQQQYLTKL